jgi:predicted PurR-regulated permease PerM
VIGMLIVWCLQILNPFILPVLWGTIIAVAIYPIYRKLENFLGGRVKIAATIYTLIALTLLITPTALVSNSLIDTSVKVTEEYKSGKLVIPTPSEKVAEWPLVGEKVYKFWNSAATNLEKTVNAYLPQIKDLAGGMLSAVAGIGGSIVQFIISIIISGVFVANAPAAYKVVISLFSRLTSEQTGKEYTDLTKDTIRSVAQGVLGVAVIQSVLSALGMYVMDVPAWGLWSVLILVMAIAQLPPLLVLVFVISYVFSVAETTPAVIFMIYSLIVSASDGFLKPLFLGRGMQTPMLVILLGAIGGMMLSGIIGLFVGAIILALGYELFMKWLNANKDQHAAESTALQDEKHND